MDVQLRIASLKRNIQMGINCVWYDVMQMYRDRIIGRSQGYRLFAAADLADDQVDALRLSYSVYNHHVPQTILSPLSPQLLPLPFLQEGILPLESPYFYGGSRVAILSELGEVEWAIFLHDLLDDAESARLFFQNGQFGAMTVLFCLGVDGAAQVEWRGKGRTSPVWPVPAMHVESD